MAFVNYVYTMSKEGTVTVAAAAAAWDCQRWFWCDLVVGFGGKQHAVVGAGLLAVDQLHGGIFFLVDVSRSYD
jgi:hypothetical protein